MSASVACDRCHQRKVKCDKVRPRCTQCERVDRECHYGVSEHQLHRRQIQRLERRNRELQAHNEDLSVRLKQAEASSSTTQSQLSEPSTSGQVILGPTAQPTCSQKDDKQVVSDVAQMSILAGGGNLFVGSTSGLLLAQLLEAQPRPHPNSSRSGSDAGKWRPRAKSEPRSNDDMSTLPPKASASELIGAYCSHDHICYPFIRIKSLYRALDVVYNAQGRETETVNALDAFFVDMCLAIGTAQVQKFNWNGVYDAETHYSRAMTRLPDVLAHNGIGRLQALLLICQYRMGTTSSNTTTSVWHIIGVAARTAVEMGLNRASTYRNEGSMGHDSPSDSESGYARRHEDSGIMLLCFWSLVALDRVTSLALGRPLAIQLEDIDVDLPQPASHHYDTLELMGPATVSTYGTLERRNAPSVFVHIVRYRLICGKTLNALHRGIRHLDGGVSAEYEEKRAVLATELEDWYAGTSSLPLVADDDGIASSSLTAVSSFLSPEWYRLLYHNGMLLIFRPSYSLCDAGQNSTVLQKIYDSSRESIGLYASLHRSRKLNYSWSTMHSVFLAGLSYIYALRTHIRHANGLRPGLGSHGPATTSYLHAAPSVNQVIHHTRRCSNVLVALSERWDKAHRWCDVFEDLSDALISDFVNIETPDAVSSVATSQQSEPWPTGSSGAESQIEMSSMPGLGNPSVDDTFRACFGELQGMGLDEFHNDAIAQLSQQWLYGLEDRIGG